MGDISQDERVLEAVRELNHQFAIHFDGCLPEACGPINDASRAIIAAVIKAHGHAYVCVINRDDEERKKPLFRYVENAMEVKNFQATYVLTEPDSELERLMLAREAARYGNMTEDEIRINAIADHAQKIGALDLIWT